MRLRSTSASLDITGLFFLGALNWVAWLPERVDFEPLSVVFIISDLVAKPD
jgi:hypothetical protein